MYSHIRYQISGLETAIVRSHTWIMENKPKPKIDILGYGLALGVGLWAALGSVIDDTTMASGSVSSLVLGLR